MRPAISVIIPTRGRTELVGQALASVHEAAANVETYEIVLVDDGSTEGEGEALRSLAGENANTRYLPLATNCGPQVARNAGIDVADGRYLKFLDSDDLLLPGSLGAELQSIEACGADLLVSGWLRSGSVDGQVQRSVAAEPRAYGDNPYDAILNGFGAPVSAVLYRREAVGDVRWDPSLRHPDDWFFLVRVLLNKPAVAVRSPPVFEWRDHAGLRQSGTSLIGYAHSRYRILEFVEMAMKSDNALTTERRKRLANYYYRDIYIAHRYDRAHYRKLSCRIADLDSDFRPGPDVETHLLMRLTGNHLSYRVYVPLHNFVRRGLRAGR